MYLVKFNAQRFLSFVSVRTINIEMIQIMNYFLHNVTKIISERVMQKR